MSADPQLLSDPILRDVPVSAGVKVLDPAAILSRVAEGGMAVVYRGLHVSLDLEVAVKVLKSTGGGFTASQIDRFRAEGRQAARINHSNLVRVFHFDQCAGMPYIVMEFVDGESLEGRVARRTRLTAREAATIAMEAAWGLDAAHDKDVIHRDIKPPNILISRRGDVKLTDLGIAKSNTDDSAVTTQANALLGTPQYMAPELWRGARYAVKESDIWAMGATLAFMLTGRHIIPGGDLPGIMQKIVVEGFPDPTTLGVEMPPEIADLIRQSTAADPTARPSAAAFADALLAYLRTVGGPLDLIATPDDAPPADPAGTAAAGSIASLSDEQRSALRNRLEESSPGTTANLPGTSDATRPPTLGEGAASIPMTNAATTLPPNGPAPKRKLTLVGLSVRLVLLGVPAVALAGGVYIAAMAYRGQTPSWAKWADELLGAALPASAPPSATVAGMADPVFDTAGPIRSPDRTPAATTPPTGRPQGQPLDIPTDGSLPLPSIVASEPPAHDLTAEIDDARSALAKLIDLESASPLQGTRVAAWKAQLADILRLQEKATTDEQRQAAARLLEDALAGLRRLHTDLSQRRTQFPDLPAAADKAAASPVAKLVLAESRIEVVEDAPAGLRRIRLLENVNAKFVKDTLAAAAKSPDKRIAARAKVLLGMLLAGESDDASAREAFRLFAEAEPDDSDATLQLAERILVGIGCPQDIASANDFKRRAMAIDKLKTAAASDSIAATRLTKLKEAAEFDTFRAQSDRVKDLVDRKKWPDFFAAVPELRAAAAREGKDAAFRALASQSVVTFWRTYRYAADDKAYVRILDANASVINTDLADIPEAAILALARLGRVTEKQVVWQFEQANPDAREDLITKQGLDLAQRAARSEHRDVQGRASFYLGVISTRQIAKLDANDAARKRQEILQYYRTGAEQTDSWSQTNFAAWLLILRKNNETPQEFRAWDDAKLLDAALDQFRLAIQKNPDDMVAMFQRSQLLRLNNRSLEEADQLLLAAAKRGHAKARELAKARGLE